MSLNRRFFISALLFLFILVAAPSCAAAEEDNEAADEEKPPNYPCEILLNGPKLPFRMIHNDLQAILHRSTINAEHVCSQYEVDRSRQAYRNFTEIVKPKKQIDELKKLLHSSTPTLADQCLKSIAQTLDMLELWDEEMKALSRLLVRVEEDCDANWKFFEEFLIDAGHFGLPKYDVEGCTGFRAQCGFGGM